MTDGIEYTYFIQQHNGGNIKIGFTRQEPKRRLSELQTANSHPLCIVGLIVGNHEKRLHKKFANIKVNGEWYKNSVELVDYIKTHTLDGYQEPLTSSPKMDKQGFLKYEIKKQIWSVSPSIGSASTVEFDWRFDKDPECGFLYLEEQMCGLGYKDNIINKMGFYDIEWEGWKEEFQTEGDFLDRDTLDSPLCEFDVFRNICYCVQKYTDGMDRFSRRSDFFKSVYINSDEWIMMVTCEPISSQTRAGYIKELATIAWDMDEWCEFGFFAYDDMNNRLYNLNQIALNEFLTTQTTQRANEVHSMGIADLHDIIERRNLKQIEVEK